MTPRAYWDSLGGLWEQHPTCPDYVRWTWSFALERTELGDWWVPKLAIDENLGPLVPVA